MTRCFTIHQTAMPFEPQASESPALIGPPQVGARERFNSIYSVVSSSPTYWNIHRDVYGAEYPEEAAPYSFVTRGDLQRIAAGVALPRRQTLVDVGCGQGGPGMWVARETGALLTGIDVSPVAVAQAATRAAAFGLGGRARFQIGEFAATGLPGSAFDAVMSVDVLWVAPDKPAALREIARILRPNSRFVFTTWDFGSSPPDEPQPTDHRPLLREAGFAVEAYEPDQTFEVHFPALLERYEAQRSALVKELGEERTERILGHYRRRLALFPGWQRILVVARLG